MSGKLRVMPHTLLSEGTTYIKIADTDRVLGIKVRVNIIHEKVDKTGNVEKNEKGQPKLQVSAGLVLMEISQDDYNRIAMNKA